MEFLAKDNNKLSDDGNTFIFLLILGQCIKNIFTLLEEKPVEAKTADDRE